MKVKITYPHIEKQSIQRSSIIKWTKWPFRLAALICPIVNICTGGRAWSIIVIWSLFMIWSHIISPSVIEYTYFSQGIKLIAQSCILLILIKAFLTPGWALKFVIFACLGGLIIVVILFFTNLVRQKGSGIMQELKKIFHTK